MKIFIYSLIITCCLMPGLVLAQSTTTPKTTPTPGDSLFDRVGRVAEPLGPFMPADGDTIFEFGGNIVSVILGLLGVIFILLMLYGGYNWMTAQGKEEKVEKAQQTIRVAIIGLLVIIAAFAIWQYIFLRVIS